MRPLFYSRCRLKVQWSINNHWKHEIEPQNILATKERLFGYVVILLSGGFNIDIDRMGMLQVHDILVKMSAQSNSQFLLCYTT